MTEIIYLDNHATTPLDPRVLKAMMPYFTNQFGNPSSLDHAFGKKAKAAVDKARAQVAAFLGADAKEIVFTSGATEANNLAIKGVAHAYKHEGNHIITVATEHKSVLDSCKRLEQQGFKVTVLPVQKDGILDLDVLRRAMTAKTILISVMLANNEIGVIQPIAQIGKIAREAGVLFHCDASQAAGKVPINVRELKIDLLSFTAHKMHGPKGIGALYIRKADHPVKLVPLSDGGGHEGGFRSGTLNVPAIVGFGTSCRISRLILAAESRRLKHLKDLLKSGILSQFPDSFVNGSEECRLPNNLNICIPNVEARLLMKRLKRVALSTGSACLSTSTETSYVLKALGLAELLRRCSIRFGIGRFNTEAEIRQVTQKVVKHAKDLQNERS